MSKVLRGRCRRKLVSKYLNGLLRLHQAELTQGLGLLLPGVVVWNSGFRRSPHAHVISAYIPRFCRFLPYPFVLVPPYRTTGIHSDSAGLVATDDYNNTNGS